MSSILVFDSCLRFLCLRLWTSFHLLARSGCISPPSSMDRVFYPEPLDRPACISLFLDRDTERRQDDGSEWVSYKKATCPICLDIIEDTDGIVLNCKKHSFHCKCAVRALQEQTTCPVCRQNLATASTSAEQSASGFRFADRLEALPTSFLRSFLSCYHVGNISLFNRDQLQEMLARQLFPESISSRESSISSRRVMPRLA